MGLIYYIIKAFANGIASIYFRKIYTIGTDNIPDEGPLIICGNHANQFVDPMMIITQCTRNISFTMAASSYSKPIVGQFARLLQVIPVYRPEDGKIKGSGKVHFTSSKEIKGRGTKFLEESTRFATTGIASIFITNRSFLLEKIIDNETIYVKESKEDYEAVKSGEYDFFYIPKTDNSRLFKAAYQRLSENGCICIFPEGTSHDRTEFLKLKAGIAWMALGAMAEYKAKRIKIVPVGLNYFKRDEFRSEVIIEFGKPFEVPQEWGDEFLTNKKDATEKLLKEIEARMKSVTLTAPSYNELRSILLVRKLYVPTEAKLSPTQYSELCKRFAKGYEKLRERPETKEMQKKTFRYIEELENTGIGDHEVKNMEFSYVWFVRMSLISVILFHVYLLLSLPAILIAAPFAFIIKKKAEKERIAAKAKNPNKIEALDVVSSVKIQYSIILMPIIFIIWCILFCYFFSMYINHKIFSCGLPTMLALAALLFPIYAYASCRMVDKLFFYLDSMISRFMYFMYPKNITKLQASRSQLTKDILEFVNTHIREVDQKYDEQRIIDQNDSEQMILMRRNSTRKLARKMVQELDTVLGHTVSKK